MTEVQASDSGYAADRELVQAYLARVPEPSCLSTERQSELKEKITAELKKQNAVLVAHYYTAAIMQELAEETGGFVADSLEMARFGKNTDASTVVVAGVRFMGETAKILSPEKRVLMPTLEATCSLDVGCPIEEFAPFCEAHPDHIVVVYANTSAAVKARSDWVVTSAIALDVVDHLASSGKKVIWAPDKHLGRYIQQQVGSEMLLWDGACIVHEEFKLKALEDMMKLYPDAAVLAHPESPLVVLDAAHMVGSTTQIINAARTRPEKDFIVATDKGIFYKLQQLAPEKNFILAPTAGEGATCRSCAHCPWMGINTFENLYDTLLSGSNEVLVNPALGEKAMLPLQRMLDFKAAL